jgi:flagellum-specific ATP synthase
MVDVAGENHQTAARKAREVLKTFRDAEDLINIGAYARGSNPKIDYAVSMIEPLQKYLQQGIFEISGFDDAVARLVQLFAVERSRVPALRGRSAGG